ncbi:unnamed protein product [Urochloa humidicola]
MESPPTSPALKRARLLPPANGGGAGQVPSGTHATRRAVPLLAAAVYNPGDFSRVSVTLVDVSSGAVAARLDGLSGVSHLGAAGGLVCLVGAASVRVLDPATGAATDVFTAPGDIAATSAVAHVHGQRRPPPPSHMFGQVPSTGEYKVLRIHAAAAAPHGGEPQTCEILSLRSVGGEQPRWLPAPSPPAPVAALSYRSKAVIHGVAHFLPLSPTPTPTSSHDQVAGECDAVASFDLATETWHPHLLRGPLSSATPGGGRRVFRGHLSLAELRGGLAMAHHDYPGGCIDVWVLAAGTSEKGMTATWTRTHSLRLMEVLRDREWLAHPLAVMDDGRIALWVEGKGLVRVFDPRTGVCVEVADLGRLCNVVGLCTAAIGNK